MGSLVTGRCDGAKALVVLALHKTTGETLGDKCKLTVLPDGNEQRNGTARKADKAQVTFEMGKTTAGPDVDDSRQSEKLTKERGKKGEFLGPCL